jgi:hypothetical protein
MAKVTTDRLFFFVYMVLFFSIAQETGGGFFMEAELNTLQYGKCTVEKGWQGA